MATFDHWYCDHCLIRISKTGATTYCHYVLDTKIVTTTLLSISLASEFLNNIVYSGNFYSWVGCFENIADKKGETKSIKHFVYITNIPQDLRNVAETARSGRLRR